MVPSVERLRPAVQLACRVVPAALFLWSGITKILDRQSAILAVNAYDVVPRALVEPVAIVLPWIEVGVAILLILGPFTRFAGWMTVRPVSVHLVAMAQAKVGDLAIDCGCFRKRRSQDGRHLVGPLARRSLAAGGVVPRSDPIGSVLLDRWFLEGSHDERDEVEDDVSRIEDGASSR